ncbi:Mobile element protein [uncultured Leptolyngbya sp.]|uniref:Mobile element protein n=2 Tax=Cyanophyceae TaxID=3028117 RepID=A0A6J4MNI0_9CYAN|nr:Mobile element protein [uncultured Leptolyngbya sp.]CAA9569340.1 Mobile element protein [uncultured Synechococcales cyanobacterium]
MLKQDRLLRALNGLNRKAFDALLPIFRVVLQKVVEVIKTAVKGS